MGAGWVTGPQELSPCARHGGPGLASFSFFCCRWEGVSGEAFPTTFWNGLPSPPRPCCTVSRMSLGVLIHS